MEKIPKWPIADKDDEKAIRQVLYSTAWWRNAGTQVKKFEEEFARYHECENGISVSNGTVALEIGLKALEIGNGDEVIVPDFTFFSTVSAVLSVNAIPVLVDVNKETFCMDPEEVERAITERTKAIILVHIAGNISGIDRICDIAKKNNIYLLEDCAHAHGAVWKGKKAGSFGELSTFSFQNAKLLTAGEGGIILTKKKTLSERIILEMNCGRRENDTKYQHVLVGTNARLTEFQGALLRSQLKKYNRQRDLRIKNYIYFREILEKIPGIKMQKLDENLIFPAHYMVMFYYNNKEFAGNSRDSLVKYLNELGIPANRSYESIHRLPIFRKISKNRWETISEYPNSINISERVVCLPHYLLLGDYDVLDDICDAISKFRK